MFRNGFEFSGQNPPPVSHSHRKVSQVLRYGWTAQNLSIDELKIKISTVATAARFKKCFCFCSLKVHSREPPVPKNVTYCTQSTMDNVPAEHTFCRTVLFDQTPTASYHDYSGSSPTIGESQGPLSATVAGRIYSACGISDNSVTSLSSGWTLSPRALSPETGEIHIIW